MRALFYLILIIIFLPALILQFILYFLFFRKEYTLNQFWNNFPHVYYTKEQSQIIIFFLCFISIVINSYLIIQFIY